MNWFKIKVNDGTEHGYNYVGSSADFIDVLVQKTRAGEYIRLDNLRYRDQRGKMLPWEEWDASLVPTVYINPSTIAAVVQFKGDPLNTPNQAKG